MYLKHKVHTVLLENIFQQQQGCTDHWWHVAYILCSSALILVVPQCGTSFMSRNAYGIIRCLLDYGKFVHP